MDIDLNSAMTVPAAATVPAADTPDASISGACPSCGAALFGKYCHACGEERIEARDLSLKHFVGKSLHEIADVEHSKLYRSFIALLFKPGFLTNEYLAGRRNLYLTPLKICFVVFALYLFCYSFYRPAALFNIGHTVEADRTGKLAAFLIDRQAAKKGVAPAAFVDQINEQWHSYMSLLQITSVPLFAITLQLAHLRSKRYFVEHLVFSMHFLSYAFLFSVIVWPLNLLTGMQLTRARVALIGPVLLVSATYLFYALRRVYHQPTAITLVKTFVLSFAYHLILAALVLLTMLLAYVHVLMWGR